MAEQPIKSSEIIDDGVFSNLIKEANIVLSLEEKIISTNKQLLASYREIASVNIGNDSKSLIEQAANNKKVESSINELRTAELNLIEVEKAKKQLLQEDLKLKRLIDSENKRAEKALQNLTGEYKKASNSLRDLKVKLKDLSIAGKENTAEYKKLNKEFENLDKKVRKADGSVGDFQRTVGNYKTALSGVSGSVAGAFSIGALVTFGKKILDTRAEFQKFEAVLTNTLGSSSAAKKSMEQIQEIAAKTPFSVKELTESYVKLVNQGFKPTTDEITKMGDLASSQGKSFDQLTEGILDAQAGEFERLKEFGIKAKKSGDNVIFTFKGVKTEVKNSSDEINKYILSLGSLEGVMGGMAAISETLGGKVSNLGDNFDTFFNNLGKDSEGVFNFILSEFNDLFTQFNNYQTILTKTRDLVKSGGGSFSTFQKIIGSSGDGLVNLQEGLDKISNGTQSRASKLNDYKATLSSLNRQFKEGEIDIQTYNNAIILVGQSVKSENEIYEASKVVKEKDIDLTKKQTAANKELKKSGGLSENLESKDVTKITEDIDKEYELKESAIDKNTEGLLENAKENQAKIDAAKKEKEEKELQETIDFGEQILDAVAKAEKKKSDAKLEAYDKELRDADKNIDMQRQLAMRGAKNTLAESEADKIRIERQKEDEKQKEIKRQKALAFFKLFASYAEKDPNTALTKALRDTILAEAVSAAFIDGTENVGKDKQFAKNKYSNGTDGYIAKFDGDERILNPEQNKMIGNLSNEALADLAYKHNNGLLDTAKFGVIQSNGFASNMANSALLMETIALRKEMQEVKAAINNKPVSNFEFNQYGDFIKTTMENGFKKITTHKQNKPRI